LKYKTAQILAIASGKGGVGKTSLAVNTGIMLSKMGYRVCLFDADTNLANINIMLKVMPEYTLEHVLRGEKSIRDIVINKSGISLVPGASGITDFINLELKEQHRLIQAVSVLEREYDYLLVDTSAGIHDNVLSFIELAHQSVLVITPEPTSLTDAFSLIRVLHKKGYKKRFNVVVNSTTSELAARKIYKRFSMAVAKYIGCKVAYLGFIIKDEQLAEAICLQSPVVISQPSALSSRCFSRISQTISKMTKQKSGGKGLSLFWKKELSTQTPNFDYQESARSIRHQYLSENQLTKRQLIVDHKHSILDFIDDLDMSREEVQGTMEQFIDAYVRRFDAFPVDLVKTLNHSLEHNRIPEKDINDLLSSLQSCQKVDSSSADKPSSKQYLSPAVSSIEEQHQSLLFDAIYTLYQSLDLRGSENAQVSNLLITLSRIYQGESNAPELLKDLAQNIGNLEKQNGNQLELTESLQQKYLMDLDKTQEPELKTVNIKSSETSKQGANELLDSIRYASLID